MSYGRMTRKEDARFVRGRGHFVDDIALPGMLHAAVLRSPYAHARIVAIDTLAPPSPIRWSRAVLTGEMLAERGLAWMPTLSHDVAGRAGHRQGPLPGPGGRVRRRRDRYAARDALALIDVEYEPLPPVIDAQPGAGRRCPACPREAETTTCSTGRRATLAAADAAFAAAEHVSACEMLYPRVHPAPPETCGVVAEHDLVSGKLTVYATAQAPHAHRVLYSRVLGIPEHRIRIVAPDIGGGFGNKVGLYPAYICAAVASELVGAPVKWVEDRSENLMATSFARDYHMRGEIAATRDGRITGLRVRVLADHGAFNATAQPSQFPAGFFHTFTGSYDVPAAHCRVTGVHTNKAPGGVSYACSFRVTEASYLVERLVDVLSYDLGLDPAGVRMRTCCGPSSSPTATPPGGSTTPATIRGRCRSPWRWPVRGPAQGTGRRRAERDAPGGTLVGVGMSFFTEAVGAGPRALMDIAGLGMADGAELRVNPTGWAVLACPACRRGRATRRRSPSSSPTSWASGWTRSGRAGRHRPHTVRARHLRVALDAGVRGGHGRRGAQGAGAGAAGGCGDAGGGAVGPGVGRGALRGAGCAGSRRLVAEIAMAAHSNLELPDGVEGHLDAMRLQPAQLDVSLRGLRLRRRGRPRHRTGRGAPVHRGRRLRCADQPNDRRGTDPRGARRRDRHGADGADRVRPDGQPSRRVVHGLPAADVDGVPGWELGETVTPSPHHPVGAKGVGESATVGSPAAVVNAVLDAIGVRHADMPLTPAQVWRASGRPLRPDIAVGDHYEAASCWPA